MRGFFAETNRGKFDYQFMTRHGFKTLTELREFQEEHPEDYEFLAHSLSEENLRRNRAGRQRGAGKRSGITPQMVQEMIDRGELS